MEGLSILVRAAQAGDTAAFSRLVEHFQDMACASAYALVEDAQLAQDVAQEAFLEAYLNITRLREPNAFLSWFRRIIFKQADRVTRGKRLAYTPLEEVADTLMSRNEPHEIAAAKEVNAQVHNAIAALPERERLVVTLFYGTGYTLKDIAAFLELPITTVKKRLYSARQRLKDSMLGTMRDVLQEQRPSLSNAFHIQARLLIAARLNDISAVQAILGHNPMLLNMQMKQNDALKQNISLMAAGVTALHEAAMHNHASLVQLLLNYGANSDKRTGSGSTPLHMTTLYRCYETLEILLAHGANTEIPHSNGLTALHLAAMKGDVHMVHLLLTYGANINCRSSHARTPLHWAALKGHVEVVQLLLARGADYSLRDSTQRTPLDWAKVSHQTTLLTLLQERIAL